MISLTPKQWLDRIPCKIYDATENKSYLIISVSKKGLWYYDTIVQYDEDAFFGDGSYKLDCPSFLSFDEVCGKMELGQEPTKKQIEWLKKYGKMTNSMTKQEACKIINKAVKDNELKIKSYETQVRNNWFAREFNKMFDDDAILGQTGGDYWDYYDGVAYIDDLD